MKLLHVVASPRGADSTSLRIAAAFLDTLRARCPDVEVDTLNLFGESLPVLDGDTIGTTYSLLRGHPVDRDHAGSWPAVEAHITRFLAADAYVISTAMWNFGIPFTLKYYIDCIVQPGYLFRFNEQYLPVPLVHGRTMACVTSRGGDYSRERPMCSLDFQEPYLKTVFGFVGITDIDFITAETTDVAELREAALTTAATRARAVAESWSTTPVPPQPTPPRTPTPVQPAC